MTLLDVATLGLITRLCTKPVFLPTQRAIRPTDLPILRARACKGVLITKPSYGETIESCKDLIEEYRAVLKNNFESESP